MTKCVTKPALSLATAAAVLAFMHAAPAMAATSTQTYVSNTGSDLNDCSTVANACATFQRAHDQTTAGGEITVVNTGNYGGAALPPRLNITKSVNITNDGAGQASILVGAAGAGIFIEGSAGDVVSLRGLVVDGQGLGEVGIVIATASAVHIQNCVIRNVEASPIANGIAFFPQFGNSQLFVSDSMIFNNGSAAMTSGIVVEPAFTSSANVVLDRVHLENNVIGLLVDGSHGTGNGAHVVIRDSVVSGNASDGIRAFTTAANAPAFLVVERTSVVNNAGTGLAANGPRATIILNDDTISRNGAGINAINSGQIVSFGNNKNFNNVGPEGAPTGLFSQM